jgi:hypothetical protein
MQLRATSRKLSLYINFFLALSYFSFFDDVMLLVCAKMSMMISQNHTDRFAFIMV